MKRAAPLLAAIVLLAAPALAGETKPAAPGATPAPASPAPDCPACAKDKEPMAVVDGVPITRGEYKEYLLKQAGDSMLDTLVNERILRSLAAKQGMSVTPQDEKDWIDQRIKDMIASGMPEYRNLDEAEVRRQYQPHAALGVLLERLVKARRTSEDGVRREYELRYGEKRHARHILFQVKQGKDGKPDAASLAAAKKRADETYEELKKGADFGEVAKKVSEDPGSRGEGGELPEFGRSDMVPEFADVAFKLKEGETSEPVLSKFGWHIIQVTKVIPPAKPFDDAVKAELRQEAAARPLDQDEVRRFLGDVRNEVKVEMKAGAGEGK